MREKIKRSLNKAARGEHEAIVAKHRDDNPAKSEDGVADEVRAPALAQLDDPTTLAHLREYFEFLASAASTATNNGQFSIRSGHRPACPVLAN